MFIYLDESGDLSFNFKKNASTHFVITLLLCEDQETVAGIKTAVKHTIKRKLNRNKQHNVMRELKSTQTLLSVKKYFLHNLRKQRNQRWSIYSIILDKKELIKKNHLPLKKHDFYNLLAKTILQQINFSFGKILKSVRLIVDRSKGKKQRDIFNQYLKTNIELILDRNTQFRIEHEESHKNAGLQAVDLFCAGFSRKYAYDDKSWYDSFKDKICIEILFDVNKHK